MCLRRTALERLRLGERRHRLRYGVEDRRALALFLLELFPVAQDVGGTLDNDVAEDVRVPAHELRADRRDDVVDAELACVFGDLRVQDDLHHQIAQFFRDAVRFAAVKGIERLVRFFEEEALQGFVGLFEVPRAASIRRAQLRDDGAETIERTDVSHDGQRRDVDRREVVEAVGTVELKVGEVMTLLNSSEKKKNVSFTLL